MNGFPLLAIASTAKPPKNPTSPSTIVMIWMMDSP